MAADMNVFNCFGVIGGDKRQIALAEGIAADGFNVYATGFETAASIKNVKMVDLLEITNVCNYIILPLPVTVDGKFLNTPYSDKKISLDDDFAKSLRGKQVYGGMMGKLYKTSEIWDEIDTYDYFTREELAVRNAVPTAEGAIEIAMREYLGTINGSNCLVVGFGRIGKTLSWMLRGIGARVTVSARNPTDIAWIDSYGFCSIHSNDICENSQYDIIFNTVPALILTRKVLSKMHPTSLIIDLASAPGGVDYEASENLGIKVIKALSLPGKVAPKSAGEIIKNTIYNMMEE